MRIDLYNLWMGDEPEAAPVRVGPFLVELVPEYEERVAKMGFYGSRKESTSFSEEDGTPQLAVTFREATRGGWEVTATATLMDTESSEKSILGAEPHSDGGVWDLYTLLTFVTGRQVTTKERTNSFDPNRYGTPACSQRETLHAADRAWSNRHVLVERGISHALHMHNEAMGLSLLQATSAIHNIALNILVDNWHSESGSDEADKARAKEVKRTINAAVMGALDQCVEIDSADRESYRALLRDRLDEGVVVERVPRAIRLESGLSRLAPRAPEFPAPGPYGDAGHLGEPFLAEGNPILGGTLELGEDAVLQHEPRCSATKDVPSSYRELATLRASPALHASVQKRPFARSARTVPLRR